MIKINKAYKGKFDRKDLKEIYNNKCGYCESLLEISCLMNIDHYRPLRGVKGLTDHRGYDWLESEWSNLISCCNVCNNKKRHSFPIEDEKKRISKPQKNKNEWLANSSSFLNEKALILHPEIDEPEKHFYLDIKGVFKHITNRGLITINTCDLNRKPLILNRRRLLVCKYRREIWKQAINIKERFDNMLITNKNELSICIQNYYKKIFKNLINDTSPKRQYTFVSRSMIKDFEFIFILPLKNITYRNIVNKAYKLFNDDLQNAISK